MIEQTSKFIIRHNKTLIAGVVLLTVILFHWFIRIEISGTYSGMFPPKRDPERVFLDKVRASLGDEYTLIIAMRHDNIFSSSTLRKIDYLTTVVGKRPAVERVLSLTNATIIKAMDDEIYSHNISGQVPTTMRKIEQFKRDIFQTPLYVGYLISADSKSTAIIVSLDTTYPSDEVRRTVGQIHSMALAMAGPEEIYLGGAPALNKTIFEMLRRDIPTFVPFTAILAALILLISFRSWWVIAFSLIVAFVSVEWTYSSMVFFKVPIFILTAIIPPIIAALAISYSVHLFAEYFRQRAVESDSKTIVNRTTLNISQAIWLSIITTAIGFACLYVVNVEAIREFSLFLTVGVLSLLILITFFIPSILIFIRPKAEHIASERLPSKATLPPLAKWIIRRRYYILTAALLLLFPCIWGLTGLNLDTDIYDLFKPSAPIRQAAEMISKTLNGDVQAYIIIEGKEDGRVEDPSLLRAIEAFQTNLEQQTVVGKTISVVDYLKTINKVFHNNNPNYLTLPRSKDEISQYLLIYSLIDSSRTLDRYVDYNHRTTKITTLSGLRSSTSLIGLKELLDKRCAEMLPSDVSCKATGDYLMFALSAKKISTGILVGFGMAVSAISIIMFLLFRSLKMGIVAMIPNLIPLLAILALMGFAKVDFNIGTSVVICLAIGIAVDDTIHFMTRFFHELRRTNHYLIRRYTNQRITADQLRAIHSTFSRVRKPIITTSAVVFCGFIVLVLSNFVPLIHLGWLTALTMVFCLLGDLILLPALLASIRI